MNPLVNVLPSKARKYLYAAFAAACLVVGALNVAQVNVGHAPEVLSYVGVAIGATAASNTVSAAKGQRSGYGDGV